MILVEDPVSWVNRRREEARRQWQERERERAGRPSPMTQLIFEILREHDGPMLIVSVANLAARQWGCASRQDRDSTRRNVFSRIGELIRMGKLERHRRKFVAIPETDEREKACRAEMDRIIRNARPRIQRPPDGAG
jgi:hypothetical protein